MTNQYAAGMRRAADILTNASNSYKRLRVEFGQENVSLETAERWLLAERDKILAAIPPAAPWTPPSVRTWSHYPVPMPVTADGKGPATIGVDAVSVEYEVWEAEPPNHAVASFDNLPDAINEAIRLSFAPLPPAPEDAP